MPRASVDRGRQLGTFHREVERDLLSVQASKYQRKDELKTFYKGRLAAGEVGVLSIEGRIEHRQRSLPAYR